eukprot:10448106-Lingulodinium_polyedra.AAC.1
MAPLAESEPQATGPRCTHPRTTRQSGAARLCTACIAAASDCVLHDVPSIVGRQRIVAAMPIQRSCGVSCQQRARSTAQHC